MCCESESKDSSPRSPDLAHVCTFDDGSCTHTKTFFDFCCCVWWKYFDFDYDYVYIDKQAGWRAHAHGLILHVHMVVKPLQLES